MPPEATLATHPNQEEVMGASGWQYVTKYQQNVQGAFAAVCQESLRSGEWREALESWTPQAVLDEIESGLSMLGPKADWHERASLLRGMLEDGTHTILDIIEVGSTQDFGIIRVATAQEVRDVYGTETPTQDDVDMRSNGFEYERWTGIAHKIYDASGTPTHWWFEGYSGD